MFITHCMAARFTFDEGGGGGLWGEAPQLSRDVWGAARPLNICPVTWFENLPGKNQACIVSFRVVSFSILAHSVRVVSFRLVRESFRFVSF